DPRQDDGALGAGHEHAVAVEPVLPEHGRPENIDLRAAIGPELVSRDAGLVGIRPVEPATAAGRGTKEAHDRRGESLSRVARVPSRGGAYSRGTRPKSYGSRAAEASPASGV